MAMHPTFRMVVVADAIDCSHWCVSMGAIIGQGTPVTFTHPGLDLNADNITEADPTFIMVVVVDAIDCSHWHVSMGAIIGQGTPVTFTHWPLGVLNTVSYSKFQTDFNDKYLTYFLWNCYQVNATTPHWLLVNIGSVNGLVLSGNKPLPEPMLT